MIEIKDLQLLPEQVSDYNLSMYSIALEGWRRGLTLNFFAGKQEGEFDIQFSLKDERKSYPFAIAKSNKVYSKQTDIFKDRLVNKENIPHAIIDYYFPETINNQKSMLYFDFDKVSDVLRKGLLDEITITNTESTEMVTKSFHAYGNINNLAFNHWLQQNALNLNLNGSVETLDSKVRSILIYGEKNSMEKFTQLLDKNVPLLQTETNPEQNTARKQGFEVIS